MSLGSLGVGKEGTPLRENASSMTLAELALAVAGDCDCLTSCRRLSIRE